MLPTKTTFSRYLCALTITLTALCTPTAFGAGFNVDFEALTIGDPPSAIPLAYPGITVAVGPLGTSIQSGVPYATLSDNVLQVNNLMSNVFSSYIGFEFAEPVTEFVFDVAMDVEDPTIVGLEVHVLCLHMLAGMEEEVDRAYPLSDMPLVSGFFEGTINFTPIATLDPGCHEIRIGKFINVPTATLAIDCVRVNNGTAPCPEVPEDSDADGVPDAIDQCPASILDFESIGCDPRLPNPLDPVTGCTRADDINEILMGARNRGQYRRQVRRYIRSLRRSREITRVERRQLFRCARSLSTVSSIK